MRLSNTRESVVLSEMILDYIKTGMNMVLCTKFLVNIIFNTNEETLLHVHVVLVSTFSKLNGKNMYSVKNFEPLDKLILCLKNYPYTTEHPFSPNLLFLSCVVMHGVIYVLCV